jgi:2-polyprenyl-6-methoxyphenol hydroxylase-like FAD-dependent oxidoreductase
VTRKRALVLGSGVAGLTCAHLLGARGWSVDCATSPATPGPVVVISRPTADLLLQLWHADETLFEGAHPLRGRLNQWEQADSPVPSAMPALVMPVDVLAARLADRAGEAGLCFVTPGQADPAHYDWIVHAGGRDAVSGESIAFGRRCGVAVSVKLTASAHTGRAVMESVPGGWLFVIPRGLGRGTLQAVFSGQIVEPCADLRALLAHSRVTSALVEEIVGEPTGFAAMPRLAITPCTSRSIAVGDAAVALDPLSGNGVGSGLRGAILATAVLDAAGRDAAPQACFDHYAQRLREAMRSHVQSCVDFYRRAAYATGWRAEIGAMVDALLRLPPGQETPSFMLNHGRLDRVP